MGKDDQGQRWQSAARSYRAALARLVRGEGRHADHAGRVVKITPTSVARDAVAIRSIRAIGTSSTRSKLPQDQARPHATWQRASPRSRPS